jgi:hypothetical protein
MEKRILRGGSPVSITNSLLYPRRQGVGMNVFVSLLEGNEQFIFPLSQVFSLRQVHFERPDRTEQPIWFVRPLTNHIRQGWNSDRLEPGVQP